MAYTTHNLHGSAIRQALEHERRALLDRYPGYSAKQLEELWRQRRAEIAAHLLDDRSTPRSLREGLEASHQGLAVDTSGTWNLPATNTLTAPAMSRSKSSTSAYLSDASPYLSNQPSRGINTTAKRTHRESEAGYPASYTYGTSTAHWQPTTSPQQQPSERELQPLEYLEIHDGSKNSQLTAKRLRVDGFDPNSLHQNQYIVSPSASMASSLSPTPFTFTSESMSRQSSVTSASVIDELGMMRLNSSFSVGSDHLFFPFETEEEQHAMLCDSILSTSTGTEVPNSSGDTIIRQPEYDFMGNVGCLSVDSQPNFLSGCFPLNSAMPMAVAAEESVDQKPTVCSQFTATNMFRTASEHSDSSHCSSDHSSSSSADVKAVLRLQKHIQNGQRQILSKTSTAGPTSGDLKKDAEPRPLRPQEPGMKRKEPIAKQQPYTRPQHPKLYCDLCDEFPHGFRGDHELKRHKDRKHTERRKVWICVDTHIKATEKWQPVRPLGICKQCKQRKTYNVYYNAAAHLRRAHFFPRKRGRKARGEKPEKRAGKAGGDVPQIGWLKQMGFLKEIEVGPEDFEEGASANDEEEEYDDDFECAPPSAAELAPNPSQGFVTSDVDLSTYDFSMPFPDYAGIAPELDVNVQWAPTAPAMQHTMSAPAAMMMTYDGLYCSEGLNFAVDTALVHGGS